MKTNDNQIFTLSDQKNIPPLRTYIAIDLKSFYASVECMERGLDPLTTNLVVADASRTQKTICLAVTPALKARGVPGIERPFPTSFLKISSILWRQEISTCILT